MRMWRHKKKTYLIITFVCCLGSFYGGLMYTSCKEPKHVQAERAEEPVTRSCQQEPYKKLQRNDTVKPGPDIVLHKSPEVLNKKPEHSHTSTIIEAHDNHSADYMSALNQTWMTWNHTGSPGMYRACVPRPKNFTKIVTGGLVIKSSSLTILQCLDNCNELGFTYAALSRGSECYCSSVKGRSALLTYVGSSHCDIPCSGEPKYNCGGQQFMSLYRTDVLDRRCSKCIVHRRGAFPLIALPSYQRSGNTWLRQLVQQGTGFLTGTIYWKNERMVLSKKYYAGKNVYYKWRQTPLIKTHVYSKEHIMIFEGAVLLIRNPYEAVGAEIFRLGNVTEGYTPKAFIFSNKWKKFVTEQARIWKETAMAWITHSRPIHIVHYENLEANTYAELVKVVRFLNIPMEKERILCATQEAPSQTLTGVRLGNYGTETRIYLTHDPFPRNLKKIVDGYIKEVNTTLQQNKLAPLPSYSVPNIF